MPLPVLGAGAAVGTAFGKLFQAVLDAINTTREFTPILNRLSLTLASIEPVFKEIKDLNRKLSGREEETEIFIGKLEEGKRLVEKCSQVVRWNAWQRFWHSRRLKKLDNSLLRFFQSDLQAILCMDTKKILVGVEEMKCILTNGYGGGPGLSHGGVAGVHGGGPPVGLEVPLQELKMRLLKNGVPLVVLSAPPGCGKTTLAEMLRHDPEIKGIFGDNIISLTVSQKPSLKIIHQNLFQRIGHHQPPNFLSDEDAIDQLKCLLIEQDCLLLVLDDVWSGSESLIQEFVFSKPGYKILVTSRFKFSRFDLTYELKPLNFKDAITLFHQTVFPSGGSSYIPEELMHEIVNGCGGFPLALTVVGGSLKGQNLAIWRCTLMKWSGEGQSKFDHNNDLLLRLKTSVDALDQTQITKDCYLDLASFPEDQRLSATALMDMWIELYDLDVEGVHTLSNLIVLSNRNLINLEFTRQFAAEMYDYCTEHFVMQHDLLRELALYLNNQECVEERKRLILDIKDNNFPRWWYEQRPKPLPARLLSISTDETFSSDWYEVELPNVEVTILNFWSKNYSLPEFIGKMHRLKVLIITNNGLFPSDINSISILGELSNLRRIRLEHLSISSLSNSFLSLPNLQKISFSTCFIQNTFPNRTGEITDIWPNLVEIEVECCPDLVEFPLILCRIPHLKKLSISNCSELAVLPEELGNLTELEALRLRSCTNLVELPESIGRLKKLRFLDVSDCVAMSRIPAEVGDLSGLRTLKLREMGDCKGLLDELPESIDELRELREVICDEEIAYQWEERYGDFCTNLRINVAKEDPHLNWLHKLHF